MIEKWTRYFVHISLSLGDSFVYLYLQSKSAVIGHSHIKRQTSSAEQTCDISHFTSYVFHDHSFLSRLEKSKRNTDITIKILGTLCSCPRTSSFRWTNQWSPTTLYLLAGLLSPPDIVCHSSCHVLWIMDLSIICAFDFTQILD